MPTPILYKGQIQFGVWKFLTDAGQAPVFGCASTQTGAPLLSDPFNAIDGAIAACTIEPSCTPTSSAIVAGPVTPGGLIVLSFTKTQGETVDAAFTVSFDATDYVDVDPSELLSSLFVSNIEEVNTGISPEVDGSTKDTPFIFVNPDDLAQTVLKGLALADMNEQVGSVATASTYAFTATPDLVEFGAGTVDAITYFEAFDPVTNATITMHSCVINHYEGV